MFYVQGAGGISFKGTLEDLLDPKWVEKTGRSQPAGDPEKSSQAAEAYRHSIAWQNRPEPLFHARQIMVSPALHVTPETTAGAAWTLMKRKGIRHLPVLSLSGQPVGIISENDFLRRFSPRGATVHGYEPDAPVSTLMAAPVYSADAMTDIRRIAHVMFDRRIGCMPVVDGDGKLMGIITRSNILLALIQSPPLNLWG